MLHAADLIQKKRDGEILSDGEIQALVAGITNLSVTDAQIAAFAMAVWFRGMEVGEERALTLAMRNSGTNLCWNGMSGPVLDKHSTGGVGDLVSLVLGPMIAACGGYVPMISGRGLGHTGGTLDKLESIPGFNTSLSKDQFQKQVKEIGISIIGQTDDLAPADRRFYAVRDVTATVASVPLIVASILSKKLAEGLDALVMDIKVGTGAFMPEVEDARRLANNICRVAVECGVACNAIITDMNHPIAWSAGNSLEVAEAISYLCGGRRHARLHTLVIEIAAELLLLGGLEKDLDTAKHRLNQVLDSGAAAERFATMIAAQGGPADFLEHSASYLPSALVVRPVTAGTSGFVKMVDVKSVGKVVVRLGGGRLRSEDGIDHAVGITDLCQPGLQLDPDTPLAIIHARNDEQWSLAARSIQGAVQVANDMSAWISSPVIRDRIEGGMTK